MDLIIAVVLFTIVFFLFYKYSSDLVNLKNDELDVLIQDGKLISSYLVSGGHPVDWHTDINNVIFVGLTGDSKKIIPEKVTAADSIDYTKLRNILSTTNDFYAFFLYKNSPINIGGITGFGKPGVTKDNIMQVEDPQDLIKTERLLFYDSKIITLEVYVW